MTLDEARAREALLFECVAGSRAYGTDGPESDVDLRGVFVMPQKRYYGLGSVEQVSDRKNDETYYELGRFVELLGKSNPNLLELLFVPDDCVRFRDPLMDLIRPSMVLSRQCEATFAGYAMTQIRKARGLNKKIVNPIEGPRKHPSEFCHVLDGQGSVPLSEWLEQRDLKRDHCGVVNVPHMPGLCAVFHDPFGGALGYRGILRGPKATEVVFSSVSKEAEPIGWMQFNQDAFQRHCREHREYHQWLENRNEERFATNRDHGRGYDSKNLMHTFRLLRMAGEIAREGTLRVRRSDAEDLLRIKQGEFGYDDLIAKAEEEMGRIGELFDGSDLPEQPDLKRLEKALVEIRDRFYGRLGS